MFLGFFGKLLAPVQMQGGGGHLGGGKAQKIRTYSGRVPGGGHAFANELNMDIEFSETFPRGITGY